jgi:hypothetical protein
MPLVLAQNEKSAADIVYADKLGVSYEYPARYRSVIQPGEKFVYYRGKRRADGSIQVPHYLGTGVIGEVTHHDGMYHCSIERYQPFETMVPFKIDGQYLEPEANGRTPKEVGLHFRTGVRILDQKSFTRINNAGLPRPEKESEPTKHKKLKKVTLPTGHKTLTQLDELALSLAVAEAKIRWPSAKIFVAPAGGEFSLAVRISKADQRHIAVKGTTAAEPLVRLTTDEVRYSETHGGTYSVWVIYGLDLDGGTGRFLDHDGPITDQDFDLAAALHGGLMRTREKGKKIGLIRG